MTDKTHNDKSPLECPKDVQCATASAFVKLHLEFEKLSSLVKTDPLTELFNYRHFCTIIDNEIERSERTGQGTTLLMIDIDHFKKVNDTWGHEVGNLALKHLADCIRQAIRRLDIPCRYGGEEFSVVLPSTDILVGSSVAERIRTVVADSPLEIEQTSISLTVSIGLAEYLYPQAKEASAFIQAADEQLYVAKQRGRNQVCFQADSHRAQQVSSDEKDALHDLFRSS